MYVSRAYELVYISINYSLKFSWQAHSILVAGIDAACRTLAVPDAGPDAQECDKTTVNLPQMFILIFSRPISARWWCTQEWWHARYWCARHGATHFRAAPTMEGTDRKSLPNIPPKYLLMMGMQSELMPVRVVRIIQNGNRLCRVRRVVSCNNRVYRHALVLGL